LLGKNQSLLPPIVILAAFAALLEAVSLEWAAIMAAVLALPVPIAVPVASVTSTSVDDHFIA